MEKGLRAPKDPEASQIRLMVPGELPALPGSGGNAGMRPEQWDSHEEGPPGDRRLLVPSQVHDVVPHGSKNPAYTSDVCVQRTGMWTWFLSPFFSSLGFPLSSAPQNVVCGQQYYLEAYGNTGSQPIRTSPGEEGACEGADVLLSCSAGQKTRSWPQGKAEVWPLVPVVPARMCLGFWLTC